METKKVLQVYGKREEISYVHIYKVRESGQVGVLMVDDEKTMFNL